jgi:hypothetical protein
MSVYGGELEAFALVGVICLWVGWAIRGIVVRHAAFKEALHIEKSGVWRIHERAYRLTRSPGLDDLDRITFERKYGGIEPEPKK